MRAPAVLADRCPQAGTRARAFVLFHLKFTGGTSVEELEAGFIHPFSIPNPSLWPFPTTSRLLISFAVLFWRLNRTYGLGDRSAWPHPHLLLCAPVARIFSIFCDSRFDPSCFTRR